MCNLKCISFLLFIVNSLNTVENKEYCDAVFNLKDGVISLSYLNMDTPQNLDDVCISPSTTISENANYGRVYKIISDRIQNSVPTLFRSSVSDFSHLVELHMPKIGIKVIKTAAFNNLVELELLNLENNKIQDIEAGMFQNTPEVTILKLQNNNLKSVNSNWINGIPNLKILNVSYNSIQNIDDGFNNVINLEILDVSHNLLTSIKANVFNQLRSLKNLNLGYNLIHQVENNAFLFTKKLHVLNLYNNNITYLSSETLDGWLTLHEIVLLYNPIPCSCLKQITTQWVAKNGINLNKNIRCGASIENIPICVETNEEVCSFSHKPDLYISLHLNQPDHKCYLPIEPLI